MKAMLTQKPSHVLSPNRSSSSRHPAKTNKCMVRSHFTTTELKLKYKFAEVLKVDVKQVMIHFIKYELVMNANENFKLLLIDYALCAC